MDKQILEEYIDACELAEETEKEIQRIEDKKRPAILGKVKGSNPDFPFQKQSFTVYGTEYSHKDDKELIRQKKILEERRKKAESIKCMVEEWMNTIPIRMQRIVKYKILEGLSWEETAIKLGRKATGEGIRKEFNRFFEKK